jgi:CheY-like chemotaxis protein
MDTVRASMPGTGRILIVDDDADVRAAIAEILTDAGYEVSCAANGAEALAQLARQPPSAIVLDLMMPVMDGWTFRVRQRMDPRFATIPTVVISAALPAEVGGGGLLDAAAVLPKPFETERLVHTLPQIC